MRVRCPELILNECKESHQDNDETNSVEEQSTTLQYRRMSTQKEGKQMQHGPEVKAANQRLFQAGLAVGEQQPSPLCPEAKLPMINSKDCSGR